MALTLRHCFVSRKLLCRGRRSFYLRQESLAAQISIIHHLLAECMTSVPKYTNGMLNICSFFLSYASLVQRHYKHHCIGSPCDSASCLRYAQSPTKSIKFKFTCCSQSQDKGWNSSFLSRRVYSVENTS